MTKTKTKTKTTKTTKKTKKKKIVRTPPKKAMHGKRITSTAFHAHMRFVRKNKLDRCVFLSANELKGLKEVYAADNEPVGYQRGNRKSATRAVTKLCYKGMIYAPILVAEVDLGDKEMMVGKTTIRSGNLVVIDGQARRSGCIAANEGLWALIVPCPLSVAKQMFLNINTMMTRVKSRHCLRISENSQARSVRALSHRYNAHTQQIRRLMDGVCAGMSTNGLDFVDPDAAFSQSNVKWVTTVLDLWTDSALWVEQANGTPRIGHDMASLYSSHGTMQILGYLIREEMHTKRRSIKSLLVEIKNFKNSDWHPSTRYGVVYGSTVGHLRAMLDHVRTLTLGKGDMKPQDHVNPPRLAKRWRYGKAI